LEYETKDAQYSLWERHKKYLDLHLILDGEEVVHITDTTKMKEAKAYDQEGDYMLWDGEKQQETLLEKETF
jgi:YhcH/YjgK/YiaL family protein